MKKNILVTAALVGVLSTGAFAYNNQNRGDCDNQNMQNNQGKSYKQQKCMNKGNYNKQDNQQRGMKRSMHKRDGMRLFSQLNLDDKQKYEISILRDEMRLEMKKSRGYTKRDKMANFITADGFDKAAFIKDSNPRHTLMMDTRAEFMEKAFKVLTKEQITQLKTLLTK